MLMILGALIGALIGAAFTVLVQPIYSAEAVIKIGAVGTPVYDFGRERVISELLENRSTLREIMYHKYRIHEARLRKLTLPYLMDVDKAEDPDIIRLVTYGRHEKEAIKFVRSVARWVIHRHEARHALVTKSLGDHAMLLDKVQTRFEAIFSKVDRGDISGAAETLGPFIYRLQAQADVAQSAANTYPSKIEVQPRSTGKKVQPKPLLYIITGLIGGLSIALAGVGLRREICIYLLKDERHHT
jgi:hypothetical protein